jgi:hypothetical protein
MHFWRGRAAASLTYVIVTDAPADKAAAAAVLPCLVVGRAAAGHKTVAAAGESAYFDGT